MVAPSVGVDGPRAPSASSVSGSENGLLKNGYDRSAGLRTDLIRLGIATLAAEVAVRVVAPEISPSPLLSPPLLGDISFSLVARTAARAALELVAQLGTSTILALALLRLKGWYPPPDAAEASTADSDLTPAPPPKPATLSSPQPTLGQPFSAPPPAALTPRDGRRDGFLPILIPLVLLYTTIIPLLLRLLLRIWYPTTSPYQTPSPSPFPTTWLAGLEQHVPAVAAEMRGLAEVWSTTDRVWAGTRVLGGMSAGFGLRVLLPTRPWETVAIVLAGWTAGLGASRLCDVVGV